MRMKMYRQGDVLLVATNAKPRGKAVKPERGRLILARGEATGHHHSIFAGPNVALFRPDDMPAGGAGNGPFMLVVRGDSVSLEHQEHDPVLLPPGRYEGCIQVEETVEAIREVVD